MKMKNKKLTASQIAANMVRSDNTVRRFYETSAKETNAVLSELNTSLKGLSEGMVEEMRDLYGNNKITYGKKKSLLKRIFQAFVNPFTAILFTLALVSFITDVFLAEVGEKIRRPLSLF